MFRRYSAVLFLLAMVPLLISMPAGNGQGFTTITNVSTVTTQATFTQASQYPVATTTVTSASSEGIYDGSFVMKGLGVIYCELTYMHFDALKDQRVRVNGYSSVEKSLTLYLMTEDQYKIFHAANFCDPGESGANSLLSADRVTSYVIDWTVPVDGTYYLVIETHSASDCTVTLSLTRYYSQTVVSTIYSTQTSLLLLTATKTVTSLSTQELAASSPVSGGNTMLFGALGAVVVVVVALAVGFFLFSKRKQKKG